MRTHVIINAWVIGRDPNSWEDAEEFNLERFLGSSVNVKGKDFNVIPFGSSRIGYIGTQLGIGGSSVVRK